MSSSSPAHAVFFPFPAQGHVASALHLAKLLHAGAVHVAGRSPVDALGASLWPEDDSCLEWLRGKPPRSVLYVNFGSIVVLTREQLVELAWGLAKSGHHFLWVIRDDQSKGNPIDMFPPEFAEETKGRGYVTSWCPQEVLLRDEAIGAFLTHCGWNSMLDSICNGIPMLCYPLGADQQTNCLYARKEWRIGVEVDENIKREAVARMVREVMGEEKGDEMRQRAMEWNTTRKLIFDVVGVKFSQMGMVFGAKIPSAKTIPGVEGAVRLRRSIFAGGPYK